MHPTRISAALIENLAVAEVPARRVMPGVRLYRVIAVSEYPVVSGMKSIDRDVLQSLLKRWQDGLIGEQEVHMEAEALWDEAGEWPDCPKHNPESIAIDVLCNLDALNQQLIGREDIPAILSFLATPEGEELEGWRAWEDYWSRIDFDLRERERGEAPLLPIKVR